VGDGLEVFRALGALDGLGVAALAPVGLVFARKPEEDEDDEECVLMAPDRRKAQSKAQSVRCSTLELA
jgi:hypothetical protein